MTNLSVKCSAVPGKSIHDIVRYELDSNDNIYQNALSGAPSLAKSLNANGPDGKPRPINLRETLAFTGTIAELVVLDYLNICFSKLDPKGDTIASSVPGVIRGKNSFNQIDVRVKNNNTGKLATIEVRSSNIFKKNTEEVYNVDQSLVGWYVTENKSKEIKKDFYITLYFRHKASDLESIYKNKQKLNVEIAAGASKKFVQQHGIDDSLRQGSKAQYRIVNPIIKCTEIDALANQIYQSLL